MLMVARDHFLPFSLLHAREDQYRFSVDQPSTQDVPPGPNPTGNPCAMAGFHEQAVMDATCQRVLSSPPMPPTGENVKYHDHRPIYDIQLVLEVLQTCLRNDDVAFWAKVSFDHHIEVSVTSADALRTGILRHMFSGACVLHQGPQCKSIVTGEQWSHSMAIHVIDSTLTWVEEGSLTLNDLVCICDALGITSSALRKKRSLLKKLVEHRRQLLHIGDVANCSVTELLSELGSSSSMRTIKSMSAAHGMQISDAVAKEHGRDGLLDHITTGRCAETVDSAPGCGRVVADAALQYRDVVHLQVAVLWHVVDIASKKQLCKILNIHGIDYEPADKKKKLRSRLKKYTRDVERGKMREVEAESDVVTRLRKLEEIRKNWPKLIPMAFKEKIIRDFRAATSSMTLASFTCACCARELAVSERVCRQHTEVNLQLLDGPTSHWNDPAFRAPPTPFQDGPLQGKLVDAHGVSTGGDGEVVLELCHACSRSLHRNTLPKHALANKLYVGPIPEELSDLTMIEECMVARARAKSWIVKLQERDSDAASPTSQRGLRGHTIIYPQQPDRLAEVLPPPVGETLTFICVIFVGSSKLTNEWLREKAKPLVVRREKVRRALVWLKNNNPLYKDVEISEGNLRTLPADDVLPYHIERVAHDDAQDTLVSRYDSPDLQQRPPAATTHFESVVVADVDAHTPVNQLRAAAVRHAKTRNRPFVQMAHGPRPVNEFFNVNLFPALYPTLFPYGCGGFEDRDRGKPISLKEHVKHLFSLRDKRFQTHYSFLFTAFNILQRRALLLGSSLKVKKASFAQFAKSFASVSSEAVGDVLERIEKGDGVSARTAEERKVLRLMKEVNLVTTKVPGSSAARVAMRNEIRALTMTHGMPSFYVTINPADTHNPIVKFLAGADIDVDNMLQDQVPNYWEQSTLVSANPAVGAKFFNVYLKAFVRTVLGWSDTELGVDEGVLGVVKAHYGCVEAQGRGSLHCHMLIWIEGALNPNEIRDKVMKDTEWGRRLLAYLDDTITNVVPVDPIPDVSTPWDERDPCTLRGVDLAMGDVPERLAMRMKDISRLAERVQRHRHSHTCYKHYKPGEARSCRFDLKEENFRADSSIDAETGQICLRCLDGLVNNFNMTILEAVRCNMDIQFIGSGESAKAMIYYITDYITKSQLKSHVAYAALQLAVKKCEDISDVDDDFTIKSKRLLQKCAYAMISHQELSAQQVASYLMGYEDHFTSHEFSCLYWASFERLIEWQDTEKLFGSVGDGDDGIEGEVDERSAPDIAVDGLDHLGDDTGEASGGRRAVDDGECETLEGDDDDEEVSVRIDEQGDVAMLSDQVSDYTLRPQQLGSMCLWDFVAATEKAYGGETQARGARVEEAVVDGIEDATDNGHDADGDDGGGGGDGVQRGRRAVEKFWFLPEHKECDRKHLRMRKRDVVPVPIGPALPRRDQPEKRARYCRLMLILFKPWRGLADLRELGESWEATFDGFSLTMNSSHREIVGNMQVLHECRDSRDDHMQTRTRERPRGDAGFGASGGDPGNDVEEIDMSEVLEHLEEIDRMSSRRNDEVSRDARECLDTLDEAGFFATADRGVATVGDAVVPESAPEDDSTLEDEWRDTYERRKAAWKVRASECEPAEVEVATTKINQISDAETTAEEPAVISGGDPLESPVIGTNGDLVLGAVVAKWTLNTEQKRAFEIVAQHTMCEKPEQLLMYLGGPGGTGKSRVINALRDFFDLRNEARRFRLAAYTGVAARNIGGSTLHALLQMNESQRDISAKAKRDLAAMWDGVDYLLIDELSMIGCELLHKVSRALTEAKGSTTAFGGVHVILAGDFAQLPPIGDTRLYKDVNTSAVAATSNRAQGKTLGRLLWLSFETVVMLHETMRQAGDANAGFVDLLQRLRDGCCNDKDYEVLVGRSLGRGTLTAGDEGWEFAPVIVTNNATRDVINQKAAEAFADRLGVQLHWYHAIDVHKKAVVSDPSLIEKLEGQHSGQTKHRLRRIPLVVGMPVAINQNFDVAAGVVNGSHGVLRRIRYFVDDQNQRYLKSCVVEIPNADSVAIPHLPAHHFPILPDTVELKFEHGISHKRCTIRRKQVPIEPGFAMTVHKAQGRTMKHVIVDLAGCAGTEPPYVMVSRATSLEGLVVLRGFDARQITKRRSEELRNEFRRLMCLKWRTVAKHGAGDEIQDAKRKSDDLQGGGTRGVKRKGGTDDQRGGRSKKLKGTKAQ